MSVRLQTLPVADGAPTKAPEQTKPFQLVLHEAVSTGLTEVLGPSGARAAFFHIGLTQATDAQKVHEGLVGMFGTGTQSLESSILRELFAKVGSTFDPGESMTFTRFVADARRIHSKLKRGPGLI